MGAGCCQRNNLNADWMIRAGAVPELLSLMDYHRADTVVQDNSLVALWRLAERQGSGADDITIAGGVARIARAAEEHRHNCFVQVNACMALERLYLRGGASSDGMREVADGALAAHPCNSQIKRGARRLLEVLRKEAEEEEEALVEKALQMRCQRQNSSLQQVNPRVSLELPLHEWLLELDNVGFLLEYHPELRRNFDTLN